MTRRQARTRPARSVTCGDGAGDHDMMMVTVIMVVVTIMMTVVVILVIMFGGSAPVPPRQLPVVAIEATRPSAHRCELPQPCHDH